MSGPDKNKYDLEYLQIISDLAPSDVHLILPLDILFCKTLFVQ